jgi:hypothetical protein
MGLTADTVGYNARAAWKVERSFSLRMHDGNPSRQHRTFYFGTGWLHEPPIGTDRHRSAAIGGERCELDAQALNLRTQRCSTFPGFTLPV